LNRPKEAIAALDLAEQIDPLDMRQMVERRLVQDAKPDKALMATLYGHPSTALETATEYGNAGLWQEGLDLSALVTASPQIMPLVLYYRAQFAERLGKIEDAQDFRGLAAGLQTDDAAFPFQWEIIHVLRRAMVTNPKDANAPYLLGNLLFDWQPEEATQLWEQAAALDPSNPILQRNLAIAYSHRGTNSDPAKAVAYLERAVASERKFAMHFTELDELYAEIGKPPAARLALLERNHDIVVKRDDSLSREIGLKIFAGRYDEAIYLMTGRKFSVWEGGTLDVADHWVNAHILRGQQRLAAKQFSAALADFQVAQNIPDNLPSDRGGGRGREAEICYWLGLTHEAQGNSVSAGQYWDSAISATSDRPGRRGGAGGGAGFISERSIQRYYQAIAQKKLKQIRGTADQSKADAEADSALRGLIDAANRALERSNAGNAESFGDRQSPRNRAALAHYVAGLGHLGLGETDKAMQEFASALEAVPDHLGAKTALADLSQP
jgi:tetratricopeptide (TPR) repeat protein